MKDRRCFWYTVAAVSCYVLALVSVVLIGVLVPDPIDLLRQYGTHAAGLGALASWYFVFGNLKYSRWREEQEGVHVVVFSTVIGITLTWVFIARFFTLDPVTQFIIGVCIYVTMFFLMLWRDVIFTRVQLIARRKMRRANAPEH